MKYTLTKVGGPLLVGLGIIVSACSAADPGDEQLGSHSQAQVADPVAFCNASGLNVIIGTSNPDVITGTEGADCIAALGGSDTVNALGGDDIVFGGEGDDQIDGGAGNDNVIDCIARNRLDAGLGTDVCAFDPTMSTAVNCETFVTCP